MSEFVEIEDWDNWVEEWAKLDSEYRKRHILGTTDDLLAGFLYYDRKEDVCLGRGAIEWSVANGDVSVEEIIIRFGEGLARHLLS